jgi:ER membrane protein complex subunit 3
MYLSERGYKSRKAFFCKEGDGFFNVKLEAKQADIMNPNMMVDMMKKNLVNALYYVLIFVGVGYLFSGFILLKLPFGLTQKFKSMMQQGINLPDLDVSYVSAISWCFLLVFGLNNILQHFDGEDNFSMMKEQEQMMKAPLMPFQDQGKDMEKICQSEKESIEIMPQFSLIEDATDKLIEKYQYMLIN